MERVGVFDIRAFGSALQPAHRLARVLGLAEKAFELDHAHFVHGGGVAEGGGPFVPLDGFHGVFACAAAFFVAELAADGCAVGGGGVAGFGGGLVEGEGFFVVCLKT